MIGNKLTPQEGVSFSVVDHMVPPLLYISPFLLFLTLSLFRVLALGSSPNLLPCPPLSSCQESVLIQQGETDKSRLIKVGDYVNVQYGKIFDRAKYSSLSPSPFTSSPSSCSSLSHLPPSGLLATAVMATTMSCTNQIPSFLERQGFPSAVLSLW
jgi:hypothetical protein